MPLYIVGAGGFGRETLDAAIACGIAVAAFLDGATAGSTIRGLPVLAPEEVSDGSYVVAIADAAARERIALSLGAAGLQPFTIVHPRSIIGPQTHIGVGCVVLANAHVSSDVRLGDHVHVNYNATVGHDAVLESYVTIYPGANVSGAVHLERGVSMGSNSCVLQGLRVGHHTFIGASALVTKDQRNGLTLVGVPARPIADRRGHEFTELEKG